jgi:hypothetical protein
MKEPPAPRPSRPEHPENMSSPARAAPTTHDPGPANPGPQLPPPRPTCRANLNPTCRAARRDIKQLLDQGVPEIVALFPDGLPPLADRKAPTDAPDQPHSRSDSG